MVYELGHGKEGSTNILLEFNVMPSYFLPRRIAKHQNRQKVGRWGYVSIIEVAAVLDLELKFS
jgi:hypothetical protein